MNGIEKITQRIESDAQAEIDRILGEARDEAARITASYRAQADAEARDLEAKNERAAAEQEERLVSAAQMKARKVQLAAKQEMVEKAYIQALDKLCAMPQEQYVAVLANLLVEASSNGREEAVFSKEDREQVGKAAVEKANQISGKQLRLSEETQPISGGFILKDKNVEVNCTFETLVRLQKAETAGAVVKTLFA
ncbi:V-type ATP synthase subunit E [Oscillibacter sp.]|uniref:V-type ATP synthase subunit E n=1 Tax=Oscillibacter sp. TaxID=1945593 RepID=UPI001B4AEDBE|nr:V-type ATP synthase subunit E [Oscillibacter sp.]MBP3510127.1 V-type ATP synthase subunit E [Oscillibacter sp.]